MDSATTTTKTERRVGQKQEKKAKAPTQAELDDFFSAAERGQQKRFTDKLVFFFLFIYQEPTGAF